MKYAMDGEAFRKNYDKVKSDPGKLWQNIKGVKGNVYSWPKSTYIAKPPFFEGFSMQPPALKAGVTGARIMGLFGDSITTDHISPAGSFKDTTPAGKYLLDQGVLKADFNSYGSRRGNHEVMMRGTFANVRIKNLMLPALPDGSREEGGYTLHQPSGEQHVHLRRGDALHGRRRADRRLRRRGIRHRARAATGLRRARNCSASRPSSRAASSASTARISSAWACCRCSSRAATVGKASG